MKKYEIEYRYWKTAPGVSVMLEHAFVVYEGEFEDFQLWLKKKYDRDLAGIVGYRES